MPPGAFKAVVLDLFDTIVKWDPERLPLLEWNGATHRSTMPWVFPLLGELFEGQFDRDRFIEVYFAVVNEINQERERERIEITCHERFARTLDRLGWAQSSRRDELAELLTRTHMAGVRRVTTAPPERITAVRTLAAHYRLGLLSNFDDERTGHEVVADTGLADLFETVVISAAVRLRKPDRRIFEHVLVRMGLQPLDVLFVGDTPRDDIWGATQAGMRTAWISRGAARVPDGMPIPDFVVPDLAALPARLSLAS
ncbi:MAG TPA: HAD family hydrolase [Candidatus Binataceae bacterium]|jgi:putative hydrolase of the HAD superfamily|nr:HAD family hydrolase [Candidatus Binataceae bacterium]